MKRRLGLFLVVMIAAIILAGCEESGSQKDSETQTLETEKIENFNENTDSQHVSELQTPTTTTETLINPIEESNFNLKPLELLGYNIDEENRVTADDKGWEACPPDVFREYMFGTWEGGNRILGELENGFLIIDDSEKNGQYNLKFACKYLKKGDTIIFYVTNYQSDAAILWLDINEPNIMYETAMNGNYLYVVTEEYFNQSDNHNNGVNIFTKTDAPVNEPENNYMSRLRLCEIMQEYGIDFETLFIIEYMIYDVGGRLHYFIMDGGFNTFPIYLISEATDKLVFKSKIMSSYGDAYIDVTYTIEKKNDEWERTVEITDEATSINPIESNITVDSINMTDDEIYQLAIEKADELQNLFINYLNFDENELAFSIKYNEITYGTYIRKDGSDDDVPFCIIDDDIFKTYNDLYMLFNETCTPEYSTQLLKFTSIQYTDIDGKLCFRGTLLCQGPQQHENLKYISFNIVNDEIKLNFTANSFFIKDIGDVQERIDSPLEQYSIFLKNIDGKWLVSDCTDIYIHGYNWNK